MSDAAFLQATLPLFAAGEVDALEWSVDVGWSMPLPDWLTGLLTLYSSQGALYGHGVELSLLSGVQTPRQDRWLDQLREESSLRKYQHFSEHFGWSTAGDVIRAAPLPLPCSPQALAVGRGRLAQLAEILEVPVGLENLALALSSRDVLAQPDFLDALLEPVGGFILLDLHNLWCQAVNFGFDPINLLERYPAARIRALHIAGGHWAEAAGRRFRRDTHDGAVPAPVHELLDAALERLPGVEVVVLERIGHTLTDDGSFAEEYRRIRARCQQHTTVPAALPPPHGPWPAPAESADLDAAQQGLLSTLLGSTGDLGVLAEWWAEADPAGQQTAGLLTRKWGRIQATD